MNEHARRIWINPGGTTHDHWHSTLHFGKHVDLDEHVVPTQEDVGSSTYLVDRLWVDDIIRRAQSGGCIEIERVNIGPSD
ncbi:MAG: hypothetical protein AAFY60_16355 [Myxococcota bacterium]